MSGMNISGLIMVQQAASGGFDCDVYPTRLAAAIQLLRVEIRRSKSPGCTMAQIELEVAELIRKEMGEMEDDEDEAEGRACSECGSPGCNGECMENL